MLEEAIHERCESHQHCGDSGPESYEDQESDAGRGSAEHNLDIGAILPDRDDCMNQQTEAEDYPGKQKPDPWSTPRKTGKHSLHSDLD